MEILRLDSNFFANFGKTPPYEETEMVGKNYPEDFLVPGDDKNFLVLNKEKAWVVHADSLLTVVEELESYLEISVDEFVLISLGSPEHSRFCIEDFEFWKELIENLRQAYYFD